MQGRMWALSKSQRYRRPSTFHAVLTAESISWRGNISRHVCVLSRV